MGALRPYINSWDILIGLMGVSKQIKHRGPTKLIDPLAFSSTIESKGWDPDVNRDTFAGNHLKREVCNYPWTKRTAAVSNWKLPDISLTAGSPKGSPRSHWTGGDRAPW